MNKKPHISFLIIVSCCLCLILASPFTAYAQAAALPDFSNLLRLVSLGENTWLPGVIGDASYSCPDGQSMNIAWTPLEGASGYEVVLTRNGTSSSYETATPSIIIPDLTPGAIYTYQIRGYQTQDDGSRIYNEYSSAVTAFTPVPKVTNLAVASWGATSDTASLGLTWAAQGDAVYQIYYKKASDPDFIYAGETAAASFNLEGLEVLQDYVVRVRGYCLSPDYAGEFSDDLSVSTCPPQVTGLQVLSSNTSQIDISWNPVTNAQSYYIYRSINDGEYVFYTTTAATSFSDINLTPGTVYSYMVVAYSEQKQIAGPYSEPLRCVTNPLGVTNLIVTGNGSKSISLAWDVQNTATGYLIYRKDPDADAFVLIGSTTEVTYTDNTVASGKNYRYKVRAYADTEAHVGDYSNVVKTSSLPACPAVKAKAGYGKLRLSWPAVTGAAGYQVYQQQADGSFALINTLEGKANTSIVYEELEIGTEYFYKVYSYRNTLEQTFVSEEPGIITVAPIPTKKTTTAAYLYKTKAKVKKSAAWKQAAATKAANYAKSYIIPGLTSTNVAGFPCTNMCPQAMCFAGKYMLISAYDRDKEENSVIYVLSKSTKKLKTVVVLENQTHAGGMCYDGSDVWVSYAAKLCSIPYSSIDKAAKEKADYVELPFARSCKLKVKASFATYYNDLIWAGSYQANKNGSLYSYRISEDDSGNVSLVSVNHLTIPRAVQGIAFHSDGRMILSRAYSYIHQLDVYKPKKSGSDGEMSLGGQLKVISMPYLSQGIDINGSYLFVNFESAVSPQSIDHIDRVLAFRLKKLLKVPKKKK